MYVLGFDAGDPYYDTKRGMEEVKAWFEENIRKVQSHKQDVISSINAEVLRCLSLSPSSPLSLSI